MYINLLYFCKASTSCHELYFPPDTIKSEKNETIKAPSPPQDIHELSEMLRDPRNANYASTFQIPSTAFFNQELIVNGISVGIIFANISAIERYREQLATVEMVGIDGTYKTLPQMPGDLRSLLTFQVLYKSVVSNFFC